MRGYSSHGILLHDFAVLVDGEGAFAGGEGDVAGALADGILFFGAEYRSFLLPADDLFFLGAKTLAKIADVWP